MGFLGFRRVVEEYEATLSATGSSPARGKAERKRYADREEALKVRGRGLEVPDGERVFVVLEGRRVGETVPAGGRFRFEASNHAGCSIPRVHEGSRLELRWNGKVMLAGVFRPD